jgi:hypothetical protein
MIIKNLLAIPFMALGLTFSSQAATLSFGTGSINTSVTGASDATTGASGFGAGVTFDLTISVTGFAGAGIGTQSAGIGVLGGQAGAGVDNDFNGTGGTNTVPVETMTFTISNVSGAASIVIDGIQVLFGVDGGPGTEFYQIDSNPVASLNSTPELVAVGGVTTVTIGARDDDGVTGSDSRFAIGGLELTVIPLPEPSSALLSFLGLATLLRRRR